MANLLFLILLLISFLPEYAKIDLDFKLRPIAFVILICLLIFQFRTQLCRTYIFSAKQSVQFCMLDIAYAACVFCITVSLIVSENIKLFYNAFVFVGMFVVYIFWRFQIHRYKNNKKFKLPNNVKLMCLIILLIGFVNALIGIFQLFCNKEAVGTFAHTSYFGCYLAMDIPVALGAVLTIIKSKAKRPKVEGHKRLNLLLILFILAFVVMFGVIVLTKSRSAIVGLGIVLLLILIRWWKSTKVRKCEGKHSPKSHQHSPVFAFKKGLLKFAITLIFVALAFLAGKHLYKLKPMSAVGRILIWKVSADMFLKKPVSGVGYGNFANQYNLYQADFFATGKGSVVNKMTAGQVRHAYNWYLETAAEFGIFGLVVFGIFWWLVLVEVYKILNHIRNIRTQKLII